VSLLAVDTRRANVGAVDSVDVQVLLAVLYV